MDWVPIYFKGEQIGEVAEDSFPGEPFIMQGKDFIVGGLEDGKFTAHMIIPDENGFPRVINGKV